MSVVSGSRSNRHASIAESRGSSASDRPVPLARLAEGNNYSGDSVSMATDGGRRQEGFRPDPNEVIIAQQMTRTPKVDRWHVSTTPGTVINSQPVPPSWIPHQLDPVSRDEFAEVVRTHTSSGKLKFAVSSEIERGSKELGEGRSWLPETVSYGEFLADMLYPDECFLLHGQSLPFTNVNFHVCEEWVPEPHRWGTHKALRPPVKGPMLTGRAFLTNHRLILFSAEKQKATSFRKLTPRSTGSGSSKPDGYQLTTTNQETVHFQSVPLTHFRNVELLVAMGTSSVTNIVGRRLFCCVPLTCCTVCYEDDMCSKYWYPRDQLTFGTNTRMLSMGVVMPPWGNRSLIEVHVPSDVPLSLMRGYMVELQRYSPGMRTTAQKPQESGYHT
ncbi:uncharacterized protein LOC110976786 [Acanthaster planci]|uniref:Uncharacterized protein LOC110976786 n=1 Tax=Acanthaster planci TaxID=133434 RepID=A0A8B7Y180_ACAPL|nr:uncharacterized protein LOC110976786 [Acanthaster planci]